MGLSTPLPLPSNLAVASSRYGIQSDYQNSRVNQVNMNVEHAFRGTVVTVGYVGEFRHFDCSIFKDFKIQERHTLQARFEAYNLTNTPKSSNPAATLGTTSIGIISSTRTGATPRDLQFAMRFSF